MSIPPTQTTSFASEAKELWTLSWPIATAQVATMLMGVVDTLFAGPLGSEPLAALAIGNISFFALFVLGAGTLRALDAHVSQAWGRDDPEDAARGLAQGHWLALIVSVPVALLILSVPRFLEFIHYDPALVEHARDYIAPLVWGVPGGILFSAYRSFLSGTNVTRPMIVAAVVANVVNLLLDWVLIDGKLGAPALGVTGIAWATSVCRWVLFGVLLLASRWHPAYRGFPSRLRAPDPALILRLAALGLPIGVTIFAEVSAFAGTGVLMGLKGAEPLAAHQVALNAAALFFMVPLGLSSGAAVRCGQARGANDVEAIARAGWTAYGVVVVWAALSATAIGLLRGPIAAAYGVDGEVLSLAVTFLGVAALFQLGDCIQVMGNGVLRGLGDTRLPMVFTLLGYGGIALPFGWFGAFVLGDDPIWLWYGLTLGLALVGALTLARFAWQLKRLRSELPAK